MLSAFCLVPPRRRLIDSAERTTVAQAIASYSRAVKGYMGAATATMCAESDRVEKQKELSEGVTAPTKMGDAEVAARVDWPTRRKTLTE